MAGRSPVVACVGSWRVKYVAALLSVKLNTWRGGGGGGSDVIPPLLRHLEAAAH